MFILVWVLPVLIGFCFGYIFASWFLIALTTLSVIVCGLMFYKNPEGLPGLIPWIVAVPTTTANITMWITHFIVTKQSWIIDWMPNIFRQ